jgi:hypothetical protein
MHALKDTEVLSVGMAHIGWGVLLTHGIINYIYIYAKNTLAINYSLMASTTPFFYKKKNNSN